MRRKSRCDLVRAAIGSRLAGAIAALLAAPPVASQRPEAQSPAIEFDKVIVTGSHLRRTESEGVLPVQVITRDEIERSGVTSVEQLLDRVPGNVNATTSAQTIGSLNQPGLAAVNLRGLGVGASLVLLNGRRLANYAFNGEAVDLNAIPLAAIDRVEVLRDGASAIYGADAIAGVVNFILRKDYAGTDIAGSIDVTQHGGGNAGQASLAHGRGDPARDGYNVFAMLSVQKQQALRGSERESTRTSYRPDLGVIGVSGLTYPANIIDRPGRRFLNPSLANGCNPPSSLPAVTGPFGSAACGFDAAAVADVLPEVERASLLLRGTWRAGPAFDVFGEALLAHNRFDVAIAPFPLPAVATSFGSPVYPAGGPYYPTQFATENGLSGPLLFSWRATELGPRLNETRSEAQRYVAGVEGQAGGWDLNVAAVYSANRQEEEYGGSYLYLSRIVPALGSGLINPWGPTGPAGRALLEAAAYSGTPQTAEGSTSQLLATAAREVLRLPAGPLAVALGAEARAERLSYDWDPAVLTGDSPIDSRLKAISGDRRVRALFAELNVPLARRLETQFAVRHDDYSDFGSTTNPKLGARWQAMEGVLLRGSWGEGFRAPPLYSLNEPLGDAGVAAGIRDPLRCPVTGGVDDCFAVIPFTFGGNPLLQPETSSQWSAGFVWEPVRGVSLSLDYWNVELEGTIVELDPNNSANYARFPSRVIRGPVDPATPDLPGPIVGFDASLINLGTTQTSGFDVNLEWRLRPGPAGNFRFSVQGTYVRQFDTQIDGIEYVSRLADATNGAPIPRWRSTATLEWKLGSWDATLGQSYASGYVEPLPGGTGVREVGASSTWDVQTRYDGYPGFRLAAGVRNVLDEAPPFSLTSSFQFGFNPQVASPLGRTFYLRAAYRFQ